MPSALLRRLQKNKYGAKELDLLYPPFLLKLLDVLAECRDKGADYHPYFGFRDAATQIQLRQSYLTGRGGYAAPAWNSAHQFGLAVDCAMDGDTAAPGLQPVWVNQSFELLGHVVQKHGLLWGGSWRNKDFPHVQWPGYVTGSDLIPLRKIWQSTDGDVEAKLKACWKHVDENSKPD